MRPSIHDTPAAVSATGRPRIGASRYTRHLAIALLGMVAACHPNASHDSAAPRTVSVHDTTPSHDVAAETSLAAIDPAEHAATIAVLAAGRRRATAAGRQPVIAILGDNAGTETTDYLVPYGVLTRALAAPEPSTHTDGSVGAAAVVALGTAAGRLRLMPALTVMPQATLAAFDTAHPAGADYVVVPALHRPDAPAVQTWLRAQATKGAVIIGICSGVKVLAAARLLDGRAATGHWHDREALVSAHPTLRWVADRRYVADAGHTPGQPTVVTTTGVSASVPVSLALVEAIAGPARAAQTAHALGHPQWDARHRSGAFRLTAAHVRTAAANRLAIWRHETLGVPVADGVDEVALALTADPYSRTYRSRARSVATVTGPVRMRSGLLLVPDVVVPTLEERATDVVDVLLPAVRDRDAAGALGATLDDIRRRYGERTAAFVALQLEYAR